MDGEPVVIHSPARPLKTGSVFLAKTARARAVPGAGGAGEHHHGDAGRSATFGMLKRKAQSISDDAIALLNIRVPHAQVPPAGSLSSSNQQKLLISRWWRLVAYSDPRRTDAVSMSAQKAKSVEPDGAQGRGDFDDLRELYRKWWA